LLWGLAFDIPLLASETELRVNKGIGEQRGKGTKGVTKGGFGYVVVLIVAGVRPMTEFMREFVSALPPSERRLYYT